MTQEDVAEKSGLSYKFIGEVERGSANPSVDTLERLAAGLGVQLADLFAGFPTAAYSSRQAEVPIAREVATSLEEIAARLRRAARPLPPVQRPKKRSKA
jgi:transcriptional regulator with XRE-family HTH domain